jgi:hypothetical protein
LALNEKGTLNGHATKDGSIDIDLLGLHRYPDPYAFLDIRLQKNSADSIDADISMNLNSFSATSETPMFILRRTSHRTISLLVSDRMKPLTISCVAFADQVKIKY